MSQNWIFISHDNPKNNYQASWLETKLTLLGYQVWLDIKDLRGGDSFWPEIQSKIKNDSAKFIAIVTKEYIEKAITPRTGVRKEIACADGHKAIKNFIIPLRFDDSKYADFPIEFQELNGFDFSVNWAEGLTKLVKELEASGIPKVNNGDNYIKKWFEANDIKNEVVEKSENYYTNWLGFQLPKTIYIHEPQHINEPVLNNFGFPYIVESRFIISFINKSTLNQKIVLNATYETQTSSFIKNEDFEINKFVNIVETKRKLINLINKSFGGFMKMKNLGVYLQSGNHEIYYFKKSSNEKKKISLKPYGRSNKSISGKSGDIEWFYAVSLSAKLYPIAHFKITYHLYFEKNGKPLSKEEQQENRRSVASGWYNKDWLDMFLAFFLKLGENEDLKIKIPVSDENSIVIDCEPFKLVSNKGYREPNYVDPVESEEEDGL